MSKGEITIQLVYRNADSWNWRKELRTVKVRPIVGDFVQFPDQMNWFKVETIVHHLESTEFDLVVYCIDAETAMGYLGDYDAVVTSQ